MTKQSRFTHLLLILRLSPCLAVAAASGASADPNILAEFRDYGSWNYTSAEAAARVTLLDDGGGELWVEMGYASAAFKFFSSPKVMVLVTSSSGEVLGEVAISDTAMGGSFNVDERHHGKKGKVEKDTFRNASYAFFRLDYCAWQMGFDRTIKATNGCAQRWVREEARKMQEFTDTLRARIGALDINLDTANVVDSVF